MQNLKAVIEWATQAGKQEALSAKHSGRDLDADGGMGLWQAFQTEFPKASWVGDYDLAIFVYSTTYASAAKACYEALTDNFAPPPDANTYLRWVASQEQ